MSTYHEVAGWLAAHPYVLWAAGALFVAFIGWLIHWELISATYWPLVGREWRADRIERKARERWARELQDRDPGDVPVWENLDADAQADQLIAEWHDDGPTVAAAMAEWWEDPDIIEWDIRQQVRRIREIRAELAALRIELLAA